MIYKVLFSLTVADVRFVLFVHVNSFCPSATGSSVLRENTIQIYESLSDKSFPFYTTHIYAICMPVYTLAHTHFASVSVLSLWNVQFKVFIIVETVPIFLRLQDSLQTTTHTHTEGLVR